MIGENFVKEISVAKYVFALRVQSEIYRYGGMIHLTQDILYIRKHLCL